MTGLALLAAAVLLAGWAAGPEPARAPLAVPTPHERAVPAPHERGEAGDPPARSPRARLRGGASQRRVAMEAAVPEVLDILRATVVAGSSPHRALQAASEIAPQPLAASLAGAVRAVSLGAGAGQALAHLGRRELLVELAVAGEALDLAETTGAPPGPVLAGVAAAAAERLRARQARLASTAQARLSARVVAGMAPCYLAVLAVTSPADVLFLVREPLGWATLAAAIVFEAAGMCWAGAIVRGRL